MQPRPLGRSGLQVPPLCFGGNVFGWTVDEKRSFDLLDRLVDAGLTFVDTANVYSVWVPDHAGGESEAIIGRWLKERGGRDRMIIATKVGMKMGDGREGLKADYIRKAVEESLARLQTDYIDLYQSHTDDKTTPLDETLAAFDGLIKAGKVRVIGASNYAAPRLKEALDVSAGAGLARYESLQPLYNLYDRAGFEDGLASLCLDQGVGVIGFFSLASGFLTGKYRSKDDLAGRTRGSRVEKYLDARGLRILGALDLIAKDRRVEQASVALAWLMAKPAVTAPIASATSLQQLKGLITATELTLSPDEVRRLDEASAPQSA